MKILKKTMLLLGFAMFVAGPVLSFATPATTFAATPEEIKIKCERSLLGIQPWFRGLAVENPDGSCGIASPGTTLPGATKPLDLTGFIWRIALNIVDIGLAVVGYIAFFFVLYGGFQFLTGGSNPGQIEKARKTILNAVIGLIISISAVAIINLVFGILG